MAEINHDFVAREKVKVVRRLSGGGTVYHDLGNLNYAFIANGSEGNLVDFRKFAQPMIDTLQSIGVNAFLGGKNDIRVGDKKISGNAEHVYKNRVLHHGTLLFSSNLDKLNESIKVDPQKYTDKAVKSIRSQVANISEITRTEIDISDFSALIFSQVKLKFQNCSEYTLLKKDIGSINDLLKTKYSTWDWNFGYSPVYTLEKKVLIGKTYLKIKLQVEKGIIINVDLENDSLNQIREIKSLLINCRHDINEIEQRIERSIHIPSKKYQLKNLIKELF